MDLKQYTERKPSLAFIIGCIINYNFHSFKKFLIYIFHYCGFLNLREIKASDFSDIEIINILTQIHPEKIDKKVLYSLTDLSKNTFNKHFKDFFIKNAFIGKRKFTLYQTYVILNEWQGKGKWSMPKSVKKQEIAEIINSGNYKKLATEFNLIKDNYKNKDKFSPKEVKELLIHIGFNDSVEEEILLKNEKFNNYSLYAFGIIMIIKVLEKSTTYNTVYRKSLK